MIIQMSVFGRFTPNNDDDYDLDALSQFFHDKFGTYLVSREVANRPHYHFIIDTHMSIQDTRYWLKKQLNGQIYLSGKQIEDKVRAVAYTIKDGNYKMNNIDVNIYLTAKVISKPKITFDSELEMLSKEYINTSDYSDELFVSQLVDLHIKYNRKLYRQHIKASYEMYRSRRDMEYKAKLVKDILGFY